ncbi:hypothetical protein TREMEDRAFT_65265 [Tremella mesenterica DSM 1558]|uniref:uncharacterized protein n=1 Tax=Tremella mesenterica (strain ATCC 24925 / CBS 8224 / DSM 1558 / NBRC 9311 / NRRL Y-6157 / RJB 2259-6 / UBC 559-6) TaxID=578456 RepID=UPI00032B9A68|nr:uncharacterized protein TREMEDRAFT_65265 [Tremella mesenterica DSM 1558]EIW66857.1 hypothetical protein TREMEDRAFT_65265 [Tremella mesenterica DSM 1558]
MKIASAIQGLKEELLKVVVVNNTDPRTKSDWIYFKQHVIGTEENQRMAETMIAANRWAARRKNEPTWLPPRSNSMRLDTSPPNPVERHSQSTGRGPLPGGKPGMMNYGLPNDPPVTWTEDGGRLSENEMTWRRENRRCLKCRSPEHYPTTVQMEEIRGTTLGDPQTRIAHQFLVDRTRSQLDPKGH